MTWDHHQQAPSAPVRRHSSASELQSVSIYFLVSHHQSTHRWCWGVLLYHDRIIRSTSTGMLHHELVAIVSRLWYPKTGCPTYFLPRLIEYASQRPSASAAFTWPLRHKALQHDHNTNIDLNAVAPKHPNQVRSAPLPKGQAP